MLMQHYLNQLVEDIGMATENSGLDSSGSLDLWDWISEEEESNTAPVRKLEEWSGIRKEMLPPVSMLNDAQLNLLLSALIEMLEAYNCHFVLQIKTPADIQYECIRQNWDQDVLVRQWHMGF
jgi:hypothetical protein